MTPLAPYTVDFPSPYDWQNLVLATNVVPENVAAARLEQSGIIRLKGRIKVEGIAAILAGEELFRLPASLCIGTVATIRFSTITGEAFACYLQIEAGQAETGLAVCSHTIKEGENLTLSGLTWSVN